MTITELRREMKAWQKKLGLEHWRVKLIWGTPVDGEPDPYKGEMCNDSVGNTFWMPESPNAIILLRRGEGIHTLVHELLHLRFDGHKTVTKYDAQHERAINHVVDVLIGKPDLKG